MTWEPMEPYRLRTASDNLDDIERTRINAENRLRARLILLGVYAAGSRRGRDDEKDPVPVAVAVMTGRPARDPLAVELAVLCDAISRLKALEAVAATGVEKAMKAHPLSGWVESRKGVGLRQGGRLLAAIGDPYLRMVVDRDGSGRRVGVRYEPRRGPAQLWAYSGNHVDNQVPADTDHNRTDAQTRRVGVGGPLSGSSDQPSTDTHMEGVAAAGSSLGSSDQTTHEAQPRIVAAAGSSPDTGHSGRDAQQHRVGVGEPAPHPDQQSRDTQRRVVGVAVRRKAHQQDNWDSIIKARAWLVVESCKQQRCAACTAAGRDKTGWAPPPENCTCADTFHYRHSYDLARIKYADAVHKTDCARCGACATCGGPLDRGVHEHLAARGCTNRKVAHARAGSPLTEAHKEARAVRLVRKEILKDLWRAARDWHHQRISADTDHEAGDSHAEVVGVGGTILDVDHRQSAAHGLRVDVDLGEDQTTHETHDSLVPAEETAA